MLPELTMNLKLPMNIGLPHSIFSTSNFNLFFLALDCGLLNWTLLCAHCILIYFQTLHLSREERQATIHFKSVASAHAFYKKYQRYILDLSVIEVDLQTV